MRPRPWGYFASAGWLVLAVLIAGGLTVAAARLGPYAVHRGGALTYRDFQAAGYLAAIWYGALIAVLALAARLRRWSVKDYFGFVLPGWRDTALALAALGVVLAAEYLVVSWLTDRGAEYQTDIVTKLYLRARAAGVLPLAGLMVYVILAGPVAEEMVFRGFLYRGWVEARFGVIPAVLVISALFALLHVQYDWLGMSFVFCDGLLLGWVRWRSGSTLLAILLHVVANLWAMILMIAQVGWR